MRLLVVEDEQRIANFIERGLKEEAYVVDVVNNGVDAFVEAIANGENALEAAKEAIKQTMFDLAKEWLKEDIKNLIYSTVGSALGMEDPKDALKNELSKMAAQDQSQHTEIMGIMNKDSITFDEMLATLYSINAKTGTQQGAGFGGLANRPLLILGALLMVLGIQMIAIGLIGEIVIFTHAKHLKEYSIEKVLL